MLHLFPFFFCCLGIIDGISTVDVIYHELQEINLTCPPYDSCSKLGHFPSENLYYQNCHCGMFCNMLGTCCVDASHKILTEPEIRPSCRQVEGDINTYFIVDQCRDGHGLPSDYETFCAEDWDGQDNVMRLVPVTSLFTNITYKNYFCLKCNEDTDDFLFWHISMEIFDTFNITNENILNIELSELSYDSIGKSWVAQFNQYYEPIPVSLQFVIPYEITTVPKACLLNVISECDESWHDIEISTKCKSYMALVDVRKSYVTYKYKNPHCALCNFENFEDIGCRSGGHEESVGYGEGSGHFSGSKTPFSFILLLDINRSDGEKVGEIKRCKENNIWDPYFRKCRVQFCVLPGFSVKDGKCVRT